MTKIINLPDFPKDNGQKKDSTEEIISREYSELKKYFRVGDTYFKNTFTPDSRKHGKDNHSFF